LQEVEEVGDEAGDAGRRGTDSEHLHLLQPEAGEGYHQRITVQ
jgi:hypothetical protein